MDDVHSDAIELVREVAILLRLFARLFRRMCSAMSAGVAVSLFESLNFTFNLINAVVLEIRNVSFGGKLRIF